MFVMIFKHEEHAYNSLEYCDDESDKSIESSFDFDYLNDTFRDRFTICNSINALKHRLMAILKVNPKFRYNNVYFVTMEDKDAVMAKLAPERLIADKRNVSYIGSIGPFDLDSVKEETSHLLKLNNTAKNITNELRIFSHRFLSGNEIISFLYEDDLEISDEIKSAPELEKLLINFDVLKEETSKMNQMFIHYKTFLETISRATCKTETATNKDLYQRFRKLYNINLIDHGNNF